MSNQDPVEFLSVEGQARPTYDCFHDRLHVEPYADISGIGVHVGYLGTAYLVIVILTGYYFLVFDPFSGPPRPAGESLHLEESAGIQEEEKRSAETRWKPNPIDVSCLRSLRRIFARPDESTTREQPRSRLRDAFHMSVWTLCDVQIATGVGILVSAFASLDGEEGISVYHWMIVIYLAWFANLTHLTGLTFLRSHLYRDASEGNWRLIFIFFLFVLLLAAEVPTIYFGASTYPSYTRCFFDVRTVLRRMELHDPFGREYELVSAPAIASMVLLTLGFLTRIIKGSMRLSRNSTRARRWGSNHAQAAIRKMARVPTSSHFFHTRPPLQRLWAALVIRPIIAKFLTWRLYVDLCVSLLSEIFWLWIAVLWGTAHIIQLRRFSYLEVSDESRLTFGQIHPILLLVLPMIPVVIQLGTAVPDLLGSTGDDSDGISDLDITSDHCGRECGPAVEPDAAPRSDLEYLFRDGDDGGDGFSLVYTAPWSTPTIWLAKAQAVFFTVAIFGELFYSLELTNILAGLIAWIVFMQASACYMVILLGLSSRGVNLGSGWLPKRLACPLSTGAVSFWWLVVLVVFAGYSLSPIWTSGRYSAEHEYSPVLQTLYQDHLGMPIAIVFHLVYSVLAGIWVTLGPGATVETVKETQERQELD